MTTTEVASKEAVRARRNYSFLFALTLTSTPEVRPITLGIFNYISANVQQWGPVMATAVLASLPAAVLLIFAQRYIAAGALGGAIK